jgi:hypothetical protein
MLDDEYVRLGGDSLGFSTAVGEPEPVLNVSESLRWWRAYEGRICGFCVGDGDCLSPARPWAVIRLTFQKKEEAGPRSVSLRSYSEVNGQYDGLC